jgi:HTH-type transcriptional regulator/antitoxin HigA
MMLLKPIETEADYLAALSEIERLWGAPEDTAEGERLDQLNALVAVYEDIHFPMDI